jgi:hypothetical protein
VTATLSLEWQLQPWAMIGALRTKTRISLNFWVGFSAPFALLLKLSILHGYHILMTIRKIIMYLKEMVNRPLQWISLVSLKHKLIKRI